MMLRGIGSVSSAEATATAAKTAIKDSERTNDWLRIIFFDGLVVLDFWFNLISG
jgi:hypothetical protein